MVPLFYKVLKGSLMGSSLYLAASSEPLARTASSQARTDEKADENE